MNENLASKEDLKDVVHKLENEFSIVRSQFNKGFSEVRLEMKDIRIEMKDLENRITFKLGGIVVVALGLFKGLEKFLL